MIVRTKSELPDSVKGYAHASGWCPNCHNEFFGSERYLVIYNTITCPHCAASLSPVHECGDDICVEYLELK